MTREISHIDPRFIVNTRGVRPVTSYHTNILKKSFLLNGYVSSNLITCRIPTAREIADFYTREPHLYDDRTAQERAQAVLKKPNADGHVFCIDGLHRRKAVLELLEEQEIARHFRICARMIQEICKEHEIALSISLNSSNEYSVKLSPCALVLQCSRYDDIVNNSGRKRRLFAAEVGRRMVQCGGEDKKMSEKAVNAMAVTRRQVIGIARKLPCSALKYLDALQETDPKSAESAFTISNLKSVPKGLNDEEAVSLLKRAHNFYRTQLPLTKPMSPHQVSENVFYVRRALKAIEKFVSLCEFSKLPSELEYIAGQMTNTDKHDEELADCSYDNDHLYEDLVQECEKKVTGGSSKIMVARRKLCYKEGAFDPEVVEPGKRNEETCDDNSVELALFPDETPRPQAEVTETDDELRGKALIDLNEQDGPEIDGKPIRLSLVSTASLECQPEPVEPPGWCLLCCGFDEFAKSRKEWSFVENKTDLAIFDIPEHEQNQDNIDKIIRHVGNCLRVTGVAHAFCSLSQFFKVIDAASRIGLSPILNPMVYIQDTDKTRRLSYSLKPQNIAEYAAVFYKSSRKSDEKHYFSTKHNYERSITPAWSNVMSNIAPSTKRVLDSSGKTFNNRERSKEMYKFILRQWCRPGGLCYHPFGKAMAVGLAAYDIGIKYVAIEEDHNCLEAAKKRILEAISRPIKRIMTEEDKDNRKRSKQGGHLCRRRMTKRKAQRLHWED